MTFITAIAPIAAAALLEVPAGTHLADALARARPGDVVRLGPGLHAGSLGRLAGLRVEGAGAEATRVVASEGQDGAIVTGRVELAGLSLEAGTARSGLKVLGGEAHLEDVALAGGAVAAFVEDGRVTARRVSLAGQYGLLQKGGDVALHTVTVRASGAARAGLAVLRGRLSLARCTVTGPFEEAAITVAGGQATLDDVVVRDPGPTGIAVNRGEVEGRDVEVAGAREVPVREPRGIDAILGDCLQLLRGTARLAWSGLVRCGGAAVSSSGGTLRLDGVDVLGGSAGGLVLLDATRADLRGNWVTGRGPGLVAASGAQVEATLNRWRTDPALWVDCGAGARVRTGPGERVASPCTGGR